MAVLADSHSGNKTGKRRTEVFRTLVLLRHFACHFRY